MRKEKEKKIGPSYMLKDRLKGSIILIRTFVV